MSQTAASTRPVLPDFGVMSDAFRHGYEQASKDEHTGWPIQYAPNERTIVEFVQNMVLILSEDARNEDGINEDGLRWLAGLLTGWLRREVPYTKGV